MPEGQLRRLATLPLMGVRGWGDRAEEHMSYTWLQMFMQAKEEQRKHLGEVGGVVDVDAEEGGEEEGDNASSTRSSKSGGSRGKVGRPRKAPKLPAKSGGQPLAAEPLPAKQATARVDPWVAAQAGAMPEWQKRAETAEAEVLLLQGKLQEAEQRAQEAERRATAAERRATAAERDRDLLRAQARKSKLKVGAQGRQQEEQTEGGGTGAGVGAGTKYLMAGSQAWKAQAEKVKGKLSAVAATARLLLQQKDRPTFESVVPGYQGAMDSHDIVERWYPGDALVEGATSQPSSPPSPPQPMGLGPPQALRLRSVALRTAFLTIVNYNGADHYPDRAARNSRKVRAILCKCANNSADYCPEVYANAART